jgi:hypothetical protein
VSDIHNVLNIRYRATPAQRADGEPVAAVTIVIAEVDVVRWTTDGQAIVAVEDDVVLEQQVRALGGEA